MPQGKMEAEDRLADLINQRAFRLFEEGRKEQATYIDLISSAIIFVPCKRFLLFFEL
jgi:hypothetical protein